MAKHTTAKKKKSATKLYNIAATKRSSLLSRRPHRSFRLTRRRDYKRSLELPGYIAFTRQVWSMLWDNKKLFGGLAIVYAVLTAILIGLASQETYTQLQSIINESGKTLFAGTWGEFGKAGILLLTSASGSLVPELTEVQQVYSGLLLLIVWLTTVWLLRVIMTGKQPKLRDGLYNAGAPLVSTALISLLLLIQSIPFAAGLLIQSATNGSISGIEAMIFWIVSVLLAVLSLYWISTTMMALIVVTLPGMYPFQALRAAGDLVVGRRLRLLLRLAWLAVTILFAWLVVLLPAIIIENALSDKFQWVSSLPIVPMLMLLLASLATVWASTYVYMLYRKVVDDDSAPA